MKLVGKSDWIFTFIMYFLDYSDYFPVIANIDDNLAISSKQKLNGLTEEWFFKMKHTMSVNDQIEIGLVSSCYILWCHLSVSSKHLFSNVVCQLN